jgi:thiol-disulfide isomerase/thioredoxin
MAKQTKRNKSRKQTRKGKKKASSSAIKMSNSKSRNANTIPNDNVDVRSKGDVGKLVDLLKKNKVVIVLVYADWCGHCQTFKKDVWSKVASLENRKVPMAQIKAEELENTPLSKTNVEGYPSVFLVGQDMKPADIPNPRDMNAMTAIANADPDEILSGAPPMESGPVAEEVNAYEEETVGNSNANLNRNGSMFGDVEGDAPAAVASPPDVGEDVMTGNTLPNANVNANGPSNFTGERLPSLNSATSTASGPPIVGGSLFSYLYNLGKTGVNVVSKGASEAAKGAGEAAKSVTKAVVRGGARKTRRGRGKARRSTARKLRY